MDKVRLGMIGSRFAARTHLANNFAKLRGFKMEVVGIASKTEASAQQSGQGVQYSLLFIPITGNFSRGRMWMSSISVPPQTSTRR